MRNEVPYMTKRKWVDDIAKMTQTTAAWNCSRDLYVHSRQLYFCYFKAVSRPLRDNNNNNIKSKET